VYGASAGQVLTRKLRDVQLKVSIRYELLF